MFLPHVCPLYFDHLCASYNLRLLRYAHLGRGARVGALLGLKTFLTVCVGLYVMDLLYST